MRDGELLGGAAAGDGGVQLGRGCGNRAHRVRLHRVCVGQQRLDPWKGCVLEAMWGMKAKRQKTNEYQFFEVERNTYAIRMRIIRERECCLSLTFFTHTHQILNVFTYVLRYKQKYLNSQ